MLCMMPLLAFCVSQKELITDLEATIKAADNELINFNLDKSLNFYLYASKLIPQIDPHTYKIPYWYYRTSLGIVVVQSLKEKNLEKMEKEFYKIWRGNF